MFFQIVTLYDTSPSVVLADLDGFQRWITQQYRAIPLHVAFVERNPYRTVSQMMCEIRSSGILYISALHNVSIFDPVVNLRFRAVHDVDHLRHGFRFDLHGEQQACRVFVERCRDVHGRNALFCEILGQACVALAKGAFPKQKLVRFPRKLRERALREDLHTAPPVALLPNRESKSCSVTPLGVRRAA